MTEILIADDHETTRQMIRRVLSTHPNWEVCAEASDGVEVVEMIKKCCPDVALIDFQMPRMNGIEAAKEVIAHCPNTFVLIESIYQFRVFVDELKKLGIRGFIEKDRIDTDLISAIEDTLNGKTHFRPV